LRKIKVTPGEKVPQSGQYVTQEGTEVTLVKGKRVPPTSKPGQSFTLVDPTKHKK